MRVRPHSRQPSARRALRLERLEQRLLLAGDIDDSLAEATSLGAISTTATTVEAAISPDVDVDMYRFSVTSGKVVDFDIDTPANGPGGLGSYIRLFNPQGVELAANDDAIAPGENTLGFDAYGRYTFTSGGTYYLGVSNANNTLYDPVTGNGDVAGGQYATGDYQLIIQALPVDTDDSFSEATILGTISTTATTVNSSVSTDIDVDMYRFSVSAGQVVDFDIDTALNGPGGLGSYIRLFNGAGQQLAANNDAVSPDENVLGFDAYLRYTFASSGNYYLGVSNANNAQYNPTTGDGDTAGGLYSIGDYQLIIQTAPVYPADPNDTLSEATSLGSISTTANTVNSSIVPKGDVDMYRFTVTQDLVVDFDIDTALNGSGGLGSYLRLFDANGQQLASNNDAIAPGESALGFDAYLRYTFNTAGTYYVGVSNANNTQYDPVAGTGDVTGGANGLGDYTLIVQALPVDPDDALSEASSLGSITSTAKTIDARIDPDIDVDMYRFTVSSQQVVDFDIDTVLNGPGGLGSFIRLFNSQGQELAANNDGAAPGELVVGFDAYLRYTFSSGGTYYLGVSNANSTQYNATTGDGDTAGGLYSIGDYQLIVQTALTDPADPDDSISEATNLGAISTTPKMVGSSITPDVDVDMYRFTVSAGQVVDFDIDTLLNGLGGLNSYLRLFNAQGQQLSSNNNAIAPGESSLVFDAYLRYTFGAAGTFYLGVSNANNTTYNPTTGTGDAAGGTNAIGSYQLTLQALPIDTDDSLVEATSLGAITATAKTVSSAIVTDIDVDIYRFTVTSGEVVGFDIDTPLNGPGGLGSYVRLFNWQGGELASNNDGLAPGETVLGFDSYLEYTFAAAGTYYLGVSNVNNVQYNAITGGGDTAGGRYSIGDYELTVQAVPEDNLTLSLSISPTTISENGGTAIGTLTRNSANISAALVVSLDNSDTTEATVPASVTIPANESSATFAISAVDDKLLDGTQTATITASAAGFIGDSAPLSVTDYTSLSLSINPTAITENQGAATGTVSRSNTNIASPLTVTLSSSDTSEATVPSLIFIPAGQPSVTFVVTAVDDAILDGTQTVTISANATSYVGDSKTIAVTDYETLTLTISPSSFSERGGTATGTVTRSNIDTAAALIVTLSNSDTSEASVPAVVTINAGQNTATFTVTAIDDALLDGTQKVLISATSAGYVGGNAVVDVQDYETLTLTILPAAISENGGMATGTVSRSNTDNGVALAVTLSSNDNSEATVPPTITIPENAASTTFVVSAVDDSLRDGTQRVVVLATASGYVSASAGVDVTDSEPSVVLSLSGDLMSENGGKLTGTVSRIASDMSQPLVVNVASSDVTAATVPVTVTIPAGQTSTAFTITAVDDMLSDGVQRATITVSAPDYGSAMQTVLVADNERPYQNPRDPLDVDGDRSVVPRDALYIINILNTFGAGQAALIMAQYQGGAVFPDTSGDNMLSPIDVLLVINKLNSPQGAGEGEASVVQMLDGTTAAFLVSSTLATTEYAQSAVFDGRESLPRAVEKLDTATDPPIPVGELRRLPSVSRAYFAGERVKRLDEFFTNLGSANDDVPWSRLLRPVRSLI